MLDASTFIDQDIINISNKKLIPIKIDAGTDEGMTLFNQFQGTAYPMIIFLDQNNTETELKPAVQTYNQQVLDAVLPRVGTQVMQYEGYIDKISKMPPPLDYPEHGRTTNYTYDISNLL